ncbi:DUF4265 domain-containing protein [Fulvivirga ligni]|uniref:DUF4265 domain-containing protein n=1 Tax=Fulvivirga ligni TaxID=2904246 RepID=UPI001F2B96E1|nr:DUF4265 domain-containing protein [Fulvivirga ligni]UII20788.1 DUF4265 domain-containing protein [Fulvivirga ligni]
MTDTSNEQEKIVFKYHSNLLDELTVETMWAQKIDPANGIYKLDSIPFYGPVIATDDEFFAEFDEQEQRLTFRRTTKHSGNSIVQVIMMTDEMDKQVIRDELKKLNCLSEGLNEKFFSVEILKSTDYKTITLLLDKYEQQSILEYAEPCLSEKHQNDITK